MNQLAEPSEKNNRRRWVVTVVAFVSLILAGGTVYWWAFIMREHHRWTEKIQLWDGQHLEIRQHSSQKAYHGAVGHFSPFWWGGGDPWGDIQFTFEGRDYRLESPYIPIAVQRDRDGTVYVVVFDRESEEAHFPTNHPVGMYYFRIYRNRGATSWEEISPEQLPLHLAIQNTWRNMQGSLDAFLEYANKVTVKE